MTERAKTSLIALIALISIWCGIGLWVLLRSNPTPELENEKQPYIIIEADGTISILQYDPATLTEFGTVITYDENGNEIEIRIPLWLFPPKIDEENLSCEDKWDRYERCISDRDTLLYYNEDMPDENVPYCSPPVECLE